MTTPAGHPIAIFTPSFADEGNTNAQNLTVKEIVARLPPEMFRITMLCEGNPDKRIACRPNTRLLPALKHGNAAYWLMHCFFPVADLYFFPRSGPLDRAWVTLRKVLRVRTSLITYVVLAMSDASTGDLALRSISKSDAVFANSAYVAETVRQRFALDPGIVYDGIDRRFFFPRPDRAMPPTAGLTVLYAGSFQQRKRVELVIEQAARHPNVVFRLAGKGETEENCRTLAKRLGCRNVAFLGHLSPHRLGEEMRSADIFLFPSVLEGHPQVLLQASACGLPSIAMNLYRPDSIVNGETGFLVKSDRELAERLDLLVQNASLRQTMSAAAIRHSCNFDWDRIVAQWANIFQQVVHRRRGVEM